MPTELEAAITLHRQGSLAEAEAIYRGILAADPGAIDALYLLGLLAQGSGRLGEAIELLGKVAAIAPQFVEPHAHLGNCLREAGRLDEAEAAYRRALAGGDNAMASDGLAAIDRLRASLNETRHSMDAGYVHQQWAYLANITEAARYGIVASYLRSVGVAGPLLDIGCGEGILCDHFPGDLVTAYVGVDISPEALKIHRGAKAAKRPVQLFCSPLEQFQPPAEMKFSAIVFNEVLFFVADPMAAVRRLAGALTPDGCIVVSWHCMPHTPDGAREEAFWQALLREFRVLDMSLLTNLPTSLSWRVAVFRPS